MLVVSVVGSFAFLLSLGLTRLLIKRSSSIGMVDAPNARSSHERPTPKGGGLSFFFVFCLVALGLFLFDPNFKKVVYPLLFGAPVVVLLGWCDDRYNISARLRLAVHFLVAIVIYALVTRWFQIDLFISFLPDFFWVSFIFCLFFIAWFINLYNFMDGADGLAAGTAVAGSLLMAVITYFHGAQEVSIIYCFMAYTISGFLYYNWQPAQIFMGDTGSYFIGFIFASLALICKVEEQISFYSHLIVFGFFIVDATYTLGMRAIRRQQVFKAHRQFAFHKLMDKGWSHREISTLYVTVMILWLFPFAHLASVYDDYGVLFVVVSYFPLLVFQVYNKAGLPEGTV
ncbi:MAG: glycosyltransferase family 4 protein [Pseudomonadota bacterium]